MAKSKLKGRKWTPEQRAKYMSTRAATEAAKKSEPSGVTDARVYLRHAVADINARLANGKLKKMDRAHLLAQLALDVLEG